MPIALAAHTAGPRRSHVGAVAIDEAARFNVRALLASVDAALPVDAVDVLARELADMVGASELSFLIAEARDEAPGGGRS